MVVDLAGNLMRIWNEQCSYVQGCQKVEAKGRIACGEYTIILTGSMPGLKLDYDDNCEDQVGEQADDSLKALQGELDKALAR
jgi:hypothetical protein